MSTPELLILVISKTCAIKFCFKTLHISLKAFHMMFVYPTIIQKKCVASETADEFPHEAFIIAFEIVYKTFQEIVEPGCRDLFPSALVSLDTDVGCYG